MPNLISNAGLYKIRYQNTLSIMSNNVSGGTMNAASFIQADFYLASFMKADFSPSVSAR
jgi:uncharacterized protein YjbI with pentapeptide repeats